MARLDKEHWQSMAGQETAQQPRTSCRKSSLREQLPPVPANVSVARERVASVAQANGASATRIEDVALAVSEAVTNAFTAHREAGSAKPVVLIAEMENGHTLEVTVADQGAGFVAPSKAEPLTPAPDSPEDVDDGLGLTVMRQLADEVEFVRSQGMTVALRFDLRT